MKEEFQRADKLFTTFSRFYTKIIAFLLGMDENSATEDSPNTIPKRRGKYCVAFDCNNGYYGVDGLRTNYHFFTFPKSVQQRTRWCNLIKRQHGKDGFLIKSSTVACSDHFTAILFYTGFPSYEALIGFFNYIRPKIPKMQYWKGKNSLKESQPYQTDDNKNKPGPSRKLPLLEEFLLVLMRLKAGLFVQDLADRFGISISPMVLNGVAVNMPPFLAGREQMTAAETEETMSIASVRIHVERAIGRIKTYHILDGTLPNTLSPYATQIATVCGLLTNFLPPLLPPAEP